MSNSCNIQPEKPYFSLLWITVWCDLVCRLRDLWYLSQWAKIPFEGVFIYLSFFFMKLWKHHFQKYLLSIIFVKTSPKMFLASKWDIGIWYFQNLRKFLEFFWIFWGIFLEFLRGFFGRNFLGEIFCLWGFFVRIFWGGFFGEEFFGRNY